MIDKGGCDRGYILNPSNCECECDNDAMLQNISIIKIVSVEKN